jgi:glycosyltransferase involved in cell wall biosynthesis
MPYSYNFFEREISSFVKRLSPKRTLDVGPGAGKWGRVFKQNNLIVDGLEIYLPYIDRFNLQKIYDTVIHGDVRLMADFSSWDLVVLGDVLEHLSTEDANQVLERMKDTNVLVMVPFKYVQGECEGNPNEAHIQDDLTEKLFHERFPGFMTLWSNEKQGIFFKGKGMDIGTGMIVKNEADVIYRCLTLSAIFSDVICVVDTGSMDQTVSELWRWARDSGWDVITRKDPVTPKCLIYSSFLEASEQDETGDWKLWDFAKARNAFIDILDPIVDRIFWMDADDQILDPAGVRTLDPTIDAYTFRIVNSRTEPTHTWDHHRLWRTGRGLQFRGRVHEYPNISCLKSFAESGIDIYHVHSDTGKEPGDKRNLRILERGYKEGERSPRSLFYYGMTLMDSDRFDEAIKKFDEYLAIGSPHHDEVVFAHIFRARCYRLAGNMEKCRECAFMGLAFDSRFSELWIEAGYAFNALNQGRKAIAMGMAAVAPMPKTSMFREKRAYTTEALRLIGG